MDKAIRDSDLLSEQTLEEIDKIYTGIVDEIFDKHKKVLEKIEKYNEQGKKSLARSLFRSSGVLDELTHAIAEAGRKANALIKEQRTGVLEVMVDDIDS